MTAKVIPFTPRRSQGEAILINVLAVLLIFGRAALGVVVQRALGSLVRR